MTDKQYRGYLVLIAIALVVVVGGKTVEHYYVDIPLAEAKAYGGK